MHDPTARQIDWLNVALKLRDRSSTLLSDAMKMRVIENEEPGDLAVQLSQATAFESAGQTLLSLAIALEAGVFP